MKSKKLVGRPVPLILMLLCILIVWTLPASAQTAPQLRDLIIFQDTSYGGWAGSGGGELNAPNAFLPTDNSETNNGFPSYNVDFSGGQWWAAIFPGPSWERYDITPYAANGMIEFSAKGEEGGEQFGIGLRDDVVGRDPLNIDTAVTTITLTDQWETYEVDINSTLTAGFEPGNMFLISLTNAGGGAVNFWINDIKITSPDPEPNVPGIKVNQLGYAPNADKVAVDSDWAFTAAPSWQVDDSLISGGAEVTTVNDPRASGEQVRQYDFSPLTDLGLYQVSAEGSNTSAAFRVGEDVFDQLLVDSMRYFLLQRQGIALDTTVAGVFARGVGHPLDANTALESDGGRSWDVSQGWYDAGDYGKYVNAGAVAVSDLLWAYELYPNEFFDGQNNLPNNESSNGIPDILDEIKWETDWFLKMQDSDSGGFYHMVKGGNEDIFPTDNPEPRNIVDVDGGRTDVRPTASTGSTVGALAHASLVFRPFDSAYADQLLASAELGWDYLEATPGGAAGVPGPYRDDDDADDRFWAAGELFRATGAAEYGDYIEANHTTNVHGLNATQDNAYFVGTSGLLGFLAYAHANGQDAAVQSYFETEFGEWTNMMIQRYEDSPWNTTLLDTDYFWGSNMMVLNTPLAMIVGANALGTETETHFNIAHGALDYVLGVNPLGFSYVSGAGSNSVENVFSNIYSYDGIDEIPPGYVAGGPNEYSNPLMYSAFGAKSYVDNNGSWTTNEHTVYWNSPLVFVAAAVADGATTTTSPIPTSTTLTTQTTDVPQISMGALWGVLLLGLVAIGTIIVARLKVS